MNVSRKVLAQALAALGILLCWSRSSQATPLAPLLAGPAEKMVQLFSGLPFNRAVPMDSLTADDAVKLMSKDLDEDAQGLDLDGQARLLAAYGFLPPRTQLKEAYLHFMGQQAAAFYSPRTGRFYNITRYGPLDALGEAVTLAHELTHAAQDQALGLTEAFKARADDDDQSRALQWVIEGHATVVGNRAGGMLSPPLPGPPGVIAGESQTFLMWTPVATAALELMMQQGPSARTPAFIRDSTFSAYADGSRFVWAAERKLGRGTALRLLCRPPRSTEETMHLDKYLAGNDPPLKVGIALPPGSSVRTELTMGEWGIAWLLKHLTGSSSAGSAARGWGGDRMALLQEGGAVWRIVMDTTEDASRLHDALANGYKQRRGRVALRLTGHEVHVFSGETGGDADLLTATMLHGAVEPHSPVVRPPPGSSCERVLGR